MMRSGCKGEDHGSAVMVDDVDSNLRIRSGSVPFKLVADSTEFYQPKNLNNKRNQSCCMINIRIPVYTAEYSLKSDRSYTLLNPKIQAMNFLQVNFYLYQNVSNLYYIE